MKRKRLQNRDDIDGVYDDTLASEGEQKKRKEKPHLGLIVWYDEPHNHSKSKRETTKYRTKPTEIFGNVFVH